MDLSVITVTWNSKQLIGQQIRSVISGCKLISWEEIIIDNASSDDTVASLKEEFPQMKVIVNVENNGFGSANNQGVAVAQGDFILFLNPDMQVEEGSLDGMVQWMRAHPDVGIASCRLVNPEGNPIRSVMPRRFPTVWNQLAIFFKLPHVFPHLLDNYLMKGFDETKEQEVDSVQGAFMLVRRELLQKLGRAFDPRYYIWFEDVDLCRETKRLGFRVLYTPVIRCVDYGGQSFGKRRFLWKQWQFFRSATKYFLKWGVL